MARERNGFSRRDFLVGGAASLGAIALTPSLAQQTAESHCATKVFCHVIGHSHIDAAWLWPWRDGADTVLTTFRSALNRMNETPGFCYSHSSSAHYRWVERADPTLFAEIRQRIREGRWEVVGGWPVEPDCNIPLKRELRSPRPLRQAILPASAGSGGQDRLQSRFLRSRRRSAHDPETRGLWLLRLHASPGT